MFFGNLYGNIWKYHEPLHMLRPVTQPNFEHPSLSTEAQLTRFSVMIHPSPVGFKSRWLSISVSSFAKPFTSTKAVSHLTCCMAALSMANCWAVSVAQQRRSAAWATASVELVLMAASCSWVAERQLAPPRHARRHYACYGWKRDALPE